MYSLTSNKQGISEILSYVLLIIIALGISVLVYGFLSSNIPKGEIPECSTDVHVIVSGVDCTFTDPAVNLTLTLQNRGLFNATGFFFRLSPSGREVQTFISTEDRYFFPREPISPGDSREVILNLDSAAPGDGQGMTLEVQPAYRTSEGIAVCERAVINQEIDCIRS